MSEESREPEAGAERPERRGGGDRRQGGDRRKENRGIWNVPVLRRLIDRRRGPDRRSGTDRRQE